VSYAIAAAGTGGHVYPGLAVGEALVDLGVDRADVLFIGGDRLEAQVFPSAGFPFLEVELAGLRRSFTAQNLRIPTVVARAVRTISGALRSRRVGSVLGMGGYVTVPAALAARRRRIPLAVSEQNASAGLANRFAARIADRRFSSFPETDGLPRAEWMGNPIRRPLAAFRRADLRQEALDRYGLAADVPVLGVFGGSLGAGAVNDAVRAMLEAWEGNPMQVLHLAGAAHAEELASVASAAGTRWVVLDYEDRMECFYAATDLVVARAGGAVAELTATGTPAILVPGRFGSGGHQEANAAALSAAGAAYLLPEDRLGDLPAVVSGLLFDRPALSTMAERAAEVARPDAAWNIARALRELHG
jgi:UDP-N-acetylglucosamine--N-acetylmuramyl-(pentapeptide) pyrophosphoryl-undecaprenol N-acetylglucosamine transferase